MKRFVEGVDREQVTLFPAVLDDYVGEDNPVRAIDVFVDGPLPPRRAGRSFRVIVTTPRVDGERLFQCHACKLGLIKLHAGRCGERSSRARGA